MVIGIIGAGISGLTAGRLLAKAGHEVTIFEKSTGYGGRMATRYAGKNNETRLDHGVSYFRAESSEFQEFTVELIDKKLIKTWGKKFSTFDGENLYSWNSNDPGTSVFTSPEGMNSIGKYLSRWVDVRTNSKVGGLTHIGGNRTRKRTWMLNFITSETFGADAVIIALPAPQAYGILVTTIDETETLTMVRQIDDIHYRPAYSLMLGYGKLDTPEWEGIICQNSILGFISNETSKREQAHECSFVLHASERFSREHRHTDEDKVIRLMLAEFSKIAGGWAASSDWHQLHFWKYSRASKALDQPFFELQDEEKPLALAGDYFEGNTVDSAYRSGYLLAKHWIEKFSD